MERTLEQVGKHAVGKSPCNFGTKQHQCETRDKDKTWHTLTRHLVQHCDKIQHCQKNSDSGSWAIDTRR